MRALWFYRVCTDDGAARAFLSVAPTADDEALWRRAALGVMEQRARWCDNDDDAVVLGVDGDRRAPTVTATFGAAATGVWDAVLRRATSTPFGSVAGAFAAAEVAPTPALKGALQNRVGRGLIEDALCVPCDSVWCALCDGDEVIATGVAYCGDPEPLEPMRLGFALPLPVMAVLPKDQQDADAIRARLGAAFGGAPWAAASAGESLVCDVCFGALCNADQRLIAIALPTGTYSEPRRGAVVEALLALIADGSAKQPGLKRRRPD